MASDNVSPLAKARNYCARQERCQQEVRDKLYSWESPKDEVEQIISQLIGDGFLNEARFAEHFAVSKSRQKGWGRRKIELAMRMKGVSDQCIALGLQAINGEEQQAELKKAVLKRMERMKDPDLMIRRHKVIRYFLGRGFSLDEVQKVINGAV